MERSCLEEGALQRPAELGVWIPQPHPCEREQQQHMSGRAAETRFWSRSR